MMQHINECAFSVLKSVRSVHTVCVWCASGLSLATFRRPDEDSRQDQGEEDQQPSIVLLQHPQG
jgi:hypothetical protein